jgi:hypothetical protein
MGGLGTLRGQPMFLTPVAQQDGQVLTIPTERLRTALNADSQLRDVVLRAYLLRRSYLIEQTAVKIVGFGASSDARRLREFLTARDVVHSWLDLDTDEQTSALLQQLPDEGQHHPIPLLGHAWLPHRRPPLSQQQASRSQDCSRSRPALDGNDPLILDQCRSLQLLGHRRLG